MTRSVQLVLSVALVLLPWIATGSRAAVLASPPDATTYGVIVGPKTKLSKLSSHELRRLFEGEAVTDEAGRRLLPINLPPRSEHRVRFDRRLLGLDPDEVGRFWVDRRIRGKGRPPRAVPTSALMLRFVASIPGAVGYMPLSAVNDSVQVLRIDGKRPGEAGYTLGARR